MMVEAVGVQAQVEQTEALPENQEARAGMPLDEFIRRQEEQPFELIGGEVIIMAPVKFGHAFVGKILLRAIDSAADPDEVGEAFPECAYTMGDIDDPNWVKGSRISDIAFFKAERLEAYKKENAEWRSRPLALVPDLCVEIVSPSENYTDVNAKVALYFEDGVKIVWIIDPQQRTIAIYERGSDQFTLLGQDRTLSGGDVLPGFEIALADIFED